MNRKVKSPLERSFAIAAYILAIGGLTLATSGAMGAAVYNLATISAVQTPTPTANCIYFQLAGVSQADPIVPNNPWFAVPTSQNGSNQIYATLAAARIAGTTVSVVTTGALAGGTCGNYAGVDHVGMP